MTTEEALKAILLDIAGYFYIENPEDQQHFVSDLRRTLRATYDEGYEDGFEQGRETCWF